MCVTRTALLRSHTCTVSTLRDVTAAETAGTAARENILGSFGGGLKIQSICILKVRKFLFIVHSFSHERLRDELKRGHREISMACLGHWDCPLSGLCQRLKLLLMELP